MYLRRWVDGALGATGRVVAASAEGPRGLVTVPEGAGRGPLTTSLSPPVTIRGDAHCCLSRLVRSPHQRAPRHHPPRHAAFRSPLRGRPGERGEVAAVQRGRAEGADYPLPRRPPAR